MKPLSGRLNYNQLESGAAGLCSSEMWLRRMVAAPGSGCDDLMSTVGNVVVRSVDHAERTLGGQCDDSDCHQALLDSKNTP